MSAGTSPKGSSAAGSGDMKVTLHVWRQSGPEDAGAIGLLANAYARRG